MRRFVLGFLAFVICAAAGGRQVSRAAGPDQPATRYTIDNCVNAFDRTRVEPTKVGYQYWFVDKDFVDGRTLKMSVVAPHEATHAPHSHAEDEFFFVLEGTAEFFLEGKTKVAGAYASFYCPPNVLHGIRNVGDTELKYLVVKKYAAATK
jgi:quercetin dioxygenase-like cupin family protein